jgi:perosamine synthetase
MAPKIPVAEPDLSQLEEQFLVEAIRSGWVSSIGPFIDRFEREFANFCGVRHCVALANGTVALHVALLAAGVGPGDEVIVPDMTFVATAAAVRHVGAEPVLVDVDRETLTLDVELTARAITSRTKAIIPVHLFGVPADMDALRAVAKERGLFLLEDAAEAHGAKIGGRPVGSLGDAATFSFYGNKLITTGEGGCVVTDDTGLADRVRFLKDHAMSKSRRYYHPEVGFNYRMTNLQAALGCAQIARFPEMLGRRMAVLAEYRRQLEGLPLRLNPVVPGREEVCWLVYARLESPEATQALATALADVGFDTRPLFVPMHELPPYAECRFVTSGQSANESVSSRESVRGLCLPSSNRLGFADVARLAEVASVSLAGKAHA